MCMRTAYYSVEAYGLCDLKKESYAEPHTELKHRKGEESFFYKQNTFAKKK